jgi:hypothetical protein
MKLMWSEGLRAGIGVAVCGLGMAWAGIAQAQSISTTTVQGTVYLANGQPATGTVLVSWPAFTTATNQAVAAGLITVPIATDGFLSVNLTPNQGATPAGLFYTAVYQLNNGSTSTEYWVVPAAAQASLGSVRAQVMPAAQAVQTVSKSYVDQAITELTGSLLTATGGTLSGPLYLSGDPTQPLQAADKHYVDTSVTSAESAVLSEGTVSRVDQFPGADFGAKLQACLSALSAVNGGTCDGRDFSATQAMGSTVQIATPNATVLLPCATIATANQVIVTAGTRNVSLRGCALRGTSAAGGNQGGTVFLYSGTGAMVRVGDPTYAVDTQGFHLDNVAINTTTATSASAQGLAAYRTQEMDLESLYFLGNSNQTGMTLDGTGNYTGGTFFDNDFTGFQTAVNGIGHQVANAATTDWMNASTFVRLHIDCPTSGGNAIAGTVGINLQQGDGNTFTGGDVESCSTALHLGPNAQNNTIVGLRNENSTNQIVADAGSAYNNWITGGTMFTGKLTDNGTRNSFLDTFHRSFNGLNGDWYGSQQDATLTNHYRLGIAAGNERGLLNRYQTDYGYRWTMGLSDATGGAQYYQILDELNNVYRVSIGQYNNGQSSTNNQTVINAAGSGAVVLNGSTNAGTGGLVVGSGGTNITTSATISGTGNAQFIGNLQVGGTSTFAGSTTVRNQADAEIDQLLWAGATVSQKESLTYKDWNGNSQWYLVKDASNNWALNSASGGLDSFKAYQSTNSGDTYIDASNPSGVVRVNFETGSGTGFKVYGGNSSSLYASFTGATSIQFPGLAATSGSNCLQIDNSGYITNTGAACGTGSSNGTVNAGSLGQIAYYAGNGAALSGEGAVAIGQGGTGAATAAGALSNLGALPLAGGTLTGPLTATNETVTGTLGVTGNTSLSALTVQNSISANTPIIDVRAYGVLGDARSGKDGAVAAGAMQMTSATLACTAADVSKILTINGAGASGTMLLATVTSCSSSTAVNFTPAASTTVSSNAAWAVGTDNTVPIQNAINAGLADCGASIFFPHGVFFVNGNLRVNYQPYTSGCSYLLNGYSWFPLRITGDGAQSSIIVQNSSTSPLLTLLPQDGPRYEVDHVTLAGRGTATTGTLLEVLSTGTMLEDMDMLGTGGRCLVQHGERLSTHNLRYMNCRQAFIQGGEGQQNESYFYNTLIQAPGTTLDTITGTGAYTYNVNAVSGAFPSSGSVIADMHPAVLLADPTNNLWEGFSIKPTGQGVAGVRVTSGENIKFAHGYIEGYNSPAINPSFIIGGKNEISTTTSAMTTSSTNFTVANASWFYSVTGNALDASSVNPTGYIIYPPDYVYGSTAASSLGGGILKGNYEQVTAVFVQNTAYAARAQSGTTAYSWPAGAVVNESWLSTPGTSQVAIQDMHITSASGYSGYTFVHNPNLQEPDAEIVLGYMPDQFHTWGTGTGSDYPGYAGRALQLEGTTRIFCDSGFYGIEVHGFYNNLLTDGGSFTDSSPNGLVSFGGCSAGIATVTYTDGAASNFTNRGPQFPNLEQIGNLNVTSNGSGQFVLTDSSSGATVCAYNGSIFSCNGSSSPLAGSVTVTTPTTVNDAACFSNTAGSMKDCGSGPGTGTVTSFQASPGSWPAWLTPSVSNAATTPALSVSASSIPNAALANASITIAGQACALGASCPLAATNLSNGASGSGAVALVNAPTFTGNSTTFANGAASEVDVSIQPGSGADQIGALEFNSYGGTDEWKLRKDASNNLRLTDMVNGLDREVFYQNSETILNSGAGSSPVGINNTSGSGTGGLVVYGGGTNYSTAELTVTGSGNLTANGFVAGRFYMGSGTMTLTAGAAAGTSPSIACASSHLCDGVSGTVTLTTGTSPTTGTLATLGFPNTHTNNANCVVTPTLSGTGVVTTIGWSESTTALTLTANTALTASTVYQIRYWCGGY